VRIGGESAFIPPTIAEVATRMRALTGTEQAEARRVLGAVDGSSAINGRTG